MAADVFGRGEAKRREAGGAFPGTRHAPGDTHEGAAPGRGTPPARGAKALVVKAGESFRLLVVPADRKLDSRKARAALGVRSLRFATREEVEQLTGLRPGSIPPFGSLFGLTTSCDPALGTSPS